MNAVLASIHPTYCELIAVGKKKVEIRKTMPKRLPLPFRVFIYETQGATETPMADEDGHLTFTGRGAVIGEFTCTGFCKALDFPEVFARHPCFYSWALVNACVDQDEALKYANGKPLYGWIIEDVKIYERPRSLGNMGFPGVHAPPQSWRYVEVRE